MKLKNLFKYALIVAFLAMGTTEMVAQKKATAKKKTPARTSAAASKTSGPALSASKLVDTKYFVSTYTGQNDQWFFQWVTLRPDNHAYCDYKEGDFNASWKVVGNSLKISNGTKEIFSETSSNGGKTFSGKMSGINTCNFYDITLSHGSNFTAAGVEKDLLAGNYYAFLGYQPRSNSMIMGFPVSVKFQQEEETQGTGTFKITGENKLLAGLGGLKFDYEFGANQLITSKTNDQQDVTPYDDWTTQYFVLNLGPSKVGTLYLYLIKK